MRDLFASESESNLLTRLASVGEEPTDDSGEEEDEDEETFDYLCNECGHAFDGDPDDDGTAPECPECGSDDVEAA